MYLLIPSGDQKFFSKVYKCAHLNNNCVHSTHNCELLPRNLNQGLKKTLS